MDPIHTGSASTTRRSSKAVGVPPGDAEAVGLHARSLGIAGGVVGVTAGVLGILVLAGVSVVAAATSDHVEHPTATALFYG